MNARFNRRWPPFEAAACEVFKQLLDEGSLLLRPRSMQIPRDQVGKSPPTMCVPPGIESVQVLLIRQQYA